MNFKKFKLMAETIGIETLNKLAWIAYREKLERYNEIQRSKQQKIGA